MKDEKYIVTGMTCSACSSRVEKTVNNLAGVQNASVNLLTGTMKVAHDDSLTAEDIIAAVEKAGYGASLPEGTVKKHHNSMQDEQRGMKKRLILSISLLIPMMYISMHHMFADWFGLPIPGWVSNLFDGHANAITFTLSQFLLLLPILYANRSYFINGFRNLWHRSPNMDTLIAIGSAASLIYGCFAIFRIGYGLGHGDMALVEQYHMDVYFESAGMIVTLITLGKYMESKSKGKTSEAIERLMDLSPQTAVVERDGAEQTIPVSDVRIGDTVLIRPGTAVPVDGNVIEGTSSVDEAAITGESIPIAKGPGSTVVSASMNQNGFLKIRAEKVGEDTTIRQMIRLVEEASSSKAPIAKLADKVAGVFVPTVIAIAIVAAVIWLLCGAEFEFALSIGIAVLVISCPCALGLATPVAIMVGTGKGAENGILIKSGEALEIAHKADTVVMDKTGTITEGKPQVTDIIPFDISEKELAKIAISLENGSEHPLAESILSYGHEHGYAAEKVTNFEAIQGKGIAGDMNGKRYYAGNTTLMEQLGIPVADTVSDLERLSDSGKTPLIFATEKKVIGIIAVSDKEKPSSKQAIKLLRDMHIHVVMLTGDNERVAKAIQKRLEIPEVIAGVLPQDKESHIRKLQEEGHTVAMIGDGINDAPALARADVGIAIGAGTEVAIESADAVLIRNDLLDAVSAIRLSRAVIRNIKENLFWAFFYNCIGIPLAAGVFYPAFGLKLSPMFGAAAMSLSSVCVVFNALRLKFFKPYRNSQSIELKNTPPEETASPEADGRKEETTMTIEMNIDGMMCEHCQKHVSDALNSLDGVTATVSLEDKKAIVTIDNAMGDNGAINDTALDDMLKKAVTDAGYTVTGLTH